MEKVQPNEVRIVVEGGIVRNVGLGREVPRTLNITLTDLDIEGSNPKDDPRIADTGYGNLAWCATLFEPGDEVRKECIDKDGTTWL